MGGGGGGGASEENLISVHCQGCCYVTNFEACSLNAFTRKNITKASELA